MRQQPMLHPFMKTSQQREMSIRMIQNPLLHARVITQRTFTGYNDDDDDNNNKPVHVNGFCNTDQLTPH